MVRRSPCQRTYRATPAGLWGSGGNRDIGPPGQSYSRPWQAATTPIPSCARLPSRRARPSLLSLRNGARHSRGGHYRRLDDLGPAGLPCWSLLGLRTMGPHRHLLPDEPSGGEPDDHRRGDEAVCHLICPRGPGAFWATTHSVQCLTPPVDQHLSTRRWTHFGRQALGELQSRSK